jgi:4'-phosphopantetheinyl transferase
VLTDQIDVWRIDLGERAFDLSSRLALLGHDEQARAQRFLADPPRRTFIGVRSALRDILARYVAIPPVMLRFSYGPQGKPALIEQENVHFNVSHSIGAAVVAVASTRVGIDIEAIRSVPPELASAALAPVERERMEASTDPVASFYEHWTLKEAYLKGAGLGLSVPLSSVRVVPGGPQRIGGFHVANVDVRDRFAAAVALEADRGAPFPVVRLLDWASPESVAARAS